MNFYIFNNNKLLLILFFIKCFEIKKNKKILKNFEEKIARKFIIYEIRKPT